MSLSKSNKARLMKLGQAYAYRENRRLRNINEFEMSDFSMVVSKNETSKSEVVMNPMSPTRSNVGKIKVIDFLQEPEVTQTIYQEVEEVNKIKIDETSKVNKVEEVKIDEISKVNKVDKVNEVNKVEEVNKINKVEPIDNKETSNLVPRDNKVDETSKVLITFVTPVAPEVHKSEVFIRSADGSVTPVKVAVKSVTNNVTKSQEGEETETSKALVKDGELKQNIFQLWVSPCIRGFEQAFRAKFNLHPYKSKTHPTIFFGCYNGRDLNFIKKHTGFKVLIWAGSDSDYKRRPKSKQILLIMRRMRGIYHQAISKYIYDDLRTYNIFSRRLPLCFSNFDQFTPAKKGKYIYFYTSLSSLNLYGCDIMNGVYQRLKNKYKFIITANPQQIKIKYNNPPLYKKIVTQYPFLSQVRTIDPKLVRLLYQKCFIGLRLTRHDGNANTVQEMGLCGIRCCFNGDPYLPSSIPWRNVNDVVRIIEKESKKIGTYDYDMCKKVRKYLDHHKRWLNKDYYTKNLP